MNFLTVLFVATGLGLYLLLQELEDEDIEQPEIIEDVEARRR